MKKIATIGIVLAALIIAGAFLAYAQVAKKDTTPVQEKTEACPCGCDGNCGGDCGNPGCTCADAQPAGSCGIERPASCTAQADGGCGCGGKADASCGGSCGMASCGCGA